MLVYSRRKIQKVAGEPRRFALYAPTKHTGQYRLNATFCLFLLRIQASEFAEIIYILGKNQFLF